MTQLTPEEAKAAFKEAIREWMNEQVQKLGYSVLKWGAAVSVTALAYWVLAMNGWGKNIPGP
jgi:hypothetical protein